MGAVCLVCGRRPGSAPGSAVTFFRVAERKSPKKGRPPVCDPFALRRGNLRRGGCGCAVELALRWRAPLGQPRRVSSRGMRASTRMLTPQPPRRRRSQQGWDSRTSTRAFAALGPVCATRGACARAFGAERSAAKQWPVWMSAPRVPFRMRRGAQRAGWPVCRRTHRLRDLTCCGCLSGARSAKRVPQHTPPASTAGCPQRSEGTQRVGSPSLW